VNDDGQRFLQPVVTSAAIGGFVGIALIGWILALDVASIKTMIAGAAEKNLIMALFLGGALIKGVAVGAAFGIALSVRNRRARRAMAAAAAAPAGS